MSKHGLFPRMAGPVERTPVGAPASVLGVRSVNPSNIWRQFGNPDRYIGGSKPDADAYITPRGWGRWRTTTPTGIAGGFGGGAGAGAGVPGMGGAGASLGGGGSGFVDWGPQGLRLGGGLGGDLDAAAKWLPWGARAGLGGALGGTLTLGPGGIDMDGSLGGYTNAQASGPRGRVGPGVQGGLLTGYGNVGPGGSNFSPGLRPGQSKPSYCAFFPNGPGC